MARMLAVSRASRVTPAPAVTDADVMSDSTISTMVLTASDAPTEAAAPTSCPPPTATATVPAAASIFERSWACSVTAPWKESTSGELVMAERTVLMMELTDADPCGEGRADALRVDAGRAGAGHGQDLDRGVLVGRQAHAGVARHGGVIDEAPGRCS